MIRKLVSAALVVGLCACTEAPPEDALTETAENLRRMRSGLVELRLRPRAPERGPAAILGLRVLGSFELLGRDRLPRADLRYTIRTRQGTAVRRFISTGEEAFVVVGRRPHRLGSRMTQTIGRAIGNPFREVRLDEWLIEPRLTRGEGLDGEEIVRIEGRVDVSAALGDLVTFASALGGGDPLPLDADETARLTTADSASSIEIVTGADDFVLKRMFVFFGIPPPSIQLGTGAFSSLAGAGLFLDLSISQPNRPIEVAPPKDALRIEELETPAP